MGIKSKTNYIIKIIIQTIDNYNKLMMILNLKILKMVKMKINVKKIQKTLVVWILKVMNVQKQMILKMKIHVKKIQKTLVVWILKVMNAQEQMILKMKM